MIKYWKYLIVILTYNLAGAQGYDLNWPAGIQDQPNQPALGNIVLHFNGDGSVNVEKVQLKMNFESTAAIISDTAGQILFYTNGCFIANSTGDTILNGDDINPGPLHDWVCPENGYIIPQSAMMLPAPGDETKYFLFHLAATYEPNSGFDYGPLYYSLIDQTGANGKGAVSEKNIIITAQKPESFTVIRHGNGRDWWIIVPESGTDKYRIFLLSPSGLSLQSVIQTGTQGNCSGAGVIAASPDGSRVARVQKCRTIVLDFDRCSGLLYHKISFERPSSVFGGGAVFTNDGRFLAVTEHLSILTADLDVSNPVLDTFVPSDSLVGRGLYQIAPAPNGSWYLSQPHRGRFMPVLSSLSEKNPGYFNKSGLYLPAYNVRTLPWFPNFRLLDLPGSPCDTLGINTATQYFNDNSFEIFPNPTHDFINIKTTATGFSGPLHLRLTDIFGRVIMYHVIENGNCTIDLSNLPNQVYVAGLVTEQGVVVVGKILKI